MRNPLLRTVLLKCKEEVSPHRNYVRDDHHYGRTYNGQKIAWRVFFLESSSYNSSTTSQLASMVKIIKKKDYPQSFYLVLNYYRVRFFGSGYQYFEIGWQNWETKFSLLFWWFQMMLPPLEGALLLPLLHLWMWYGKIVMDLCMPKWDPNDGSRICKTTCCWSLKVLDFFLCSPLWMHDQFTNGVVFANLRIGFCISLALKQ